MGGAGGTCLQQGTWDAPPRDPGELGPAALSAGQEAGLSREGLRMERAVPSHTGYFLDAQDATGLGGASAEDGEPQGSDGEQDMGPRLLQLGGSGAPGDQLGYAPGAQGGPDGNGRVIPSGSGDSAGPEAQQAPCCHLPCGPPSCPSSGGFLSPRPPDSQLAWAQCPRPRAHLWASGRRGGRAAAGSGGPSWWPPAPVTAGQGRGRSSQAEPRLPEARRPPLL